MRREGQSDANQSAQRCPRQEEVAAYCDASLAPERQSELMSHLAACDECRETLVVLIRTSRQSKSGTSDEMISEQVARIKAYVQRDESVHHPRTGAASAAKARGVFFLSYPQLAAAALIVCAVGLAALFWLTREDRGNEAMNILTVAMSHGRRTEGWISGFTEHSDYSATRGTENREDLQFDRAFAKVKPAEEPGSPAAERLVLARVRLSMGKRDEATKALVILQDLAKIESLSASMRANVYNDTGVAYLQLGNYKAAAENFDKALAASPDIAQASFNRALALEREGRDREAREAWIQFVNSSADAAWKAEARSHLEQLAAPDLK